MAGYIKDHRQELDSKIWTMPPLYHRVWQYLKYKACFRETKLALKDGSMLRVGPGQYFTSVREIAKDVAWKERGVLKVPNPKMIDTVLSWMEGETMITFEGVTSNTPNRKTASGGNSLGTLITLMNWEFFQYEINESNAKVTPMGVTGNEKNNKDLKNLSVCLSDNAQAREPETDLGDGVPSTDHTMGEISPFKQIEDHYIERRAHGFDLSGDDIDAINAVLEDRIPMGTILAGIDDAFTHHKPRFKGDRIKSFKYCDPVIRDRHYREEMRKGGSRDAETDRGRPGHGRASPAGSGGAEAARGQPAGGYYDQFPGLIQSL